MKGFREPFKRVRVIGFCRVPHEWVKGGGCRQAMENVRKTPRYKNLLKRLQAEAEGAAVGTRSAGPRSRKSGKKDAGKLSADELRELEQRADAEVIMHGGYGKPVWHELIAVQIFVFPFTLVKVSVKPFCIALHVLAKYWEGMIRSRR